MTSAVKGVNSYTIRNNLLMGSTMTTLQITLPDQLAQEAQRAGLLTPEAIEQMLREAVRQRALGELRQAMDRMHAVTGTPMTEDEIQAEIDAVRTARRAARGR